MKRTARRTGFTHKQRTWVKDRDGWRCQANFSPECTGRPDHVHHVWMASAGGPDDEWNGLTVCWRCHDAIHGDTVSAVARGLLRRR
jgi:hypothetical protein